jgi:cytochrome b6-f complex iron-sulfur subunit
MTSQNHTNEGRRTFLQRLLLILSAFGAVMASWGVGRFLFFNESAKKKREVTSDLLKRLEPNVPVHVPEGGAWLVKVGGTDTVLALDDRCTHLGCRQKWNPEKLAFECPCHGSEFDLQGMVTRGPATRALPRLTIGPNQDDKVLLLEKPATASPS